MFLRRLPEPFRIFFPLAAALGLAGVSPWVLFALGHWPGYPGNLHAFTMSEAFLVAPAVGFLGTMVPRRTGTEPLTVLESLLIGGGLAGVPILAGLEQVRLSQLSYLVALATLGAFLVRRLRASPKERLLPASFFLMPLGVALALTGLALLLDAPAAPALQLLGRSLAQQGLMLGLVLAVTPMLSPILTHGGPPREDPATRARAPKRMAIFGAALALSFPLELAEPHAGLVLRGLVMLAALATAGRLFQRVTAPGLHRRLYKVALALTPTGLLAAGVVPAHRTAFLHLTFIGGLSVMIFAVASHIVMLHTGRRELAEGNPKPLVAVGALAVLAALTRASADFAGASFLKALLAAASMWLLAAVVWTAFILPQLVRDAPDPD